MMEAKEKNLNPVVTPGERRQKIMKKEV